MEDRGLAAPLSCAEETRWQGRCEGVTRVLHKGVRGVLQCCHTSILGGGEVKALEAEGKPSRLATFVAGVTTLGDARVLKGCHEDVTKVTEG
jgi:hypothetical protein